MKTLFLIWALSITAASQQLGAWKGLNLDTSSAKDAITALGEPKSDKTNNRYLLGRWYQKGVGKKLRILHYENIEGFPDIKLGFLDDKLAVIHLEPKQLADAALLTAYADTEFRYRSEVTSPSDFKRPRDPKRADLRRSTVYEMVAVNDSVIAESTHSGGRVLVLLVISRRIENNDGHDLLK